MHRSWLVLVAALLFDAALARRTPRPRTRGSSPPNACGRSSGSAIRRSRPTARLAVVPVTTYDIGENKGLTDLWLMPVAGGAARQLTSDKASDTQPTVSPDGKWMAFVSKRGDDTESQIYVIADRRRRSAARHQPAHRRLDAEVVSGQQAARLRERSVAGPGALGRPGGAQEGARVRRR